jgi:hypothetical protein
MIGQLEEELERGFNAALTHRSQGSELFAYQIVSSMANALHKDTSRLEVIVSNIARNEEPIRNEERINLEFYGLASTSRVEEPE